MVRGMTQARSHRTEKTSGRNFFYYHVFPAFPCARGASPGLLAARGTRTVLRGSNRDDIHDNHAD